MTTTSNRFMILFTLLGLICGFALAALILPTGAPARAAEPVAADGPAAADAPDSPFLTSAQSSSAPAVAANHSFTYQGVLRQAGQPYNGFCDFRLRIYDDLVAGTQFGSDHLITNAPVTNGQFTLQVAAFPDFPDTAFDGRSIYMQTSVSCPTGINAYTILTPRQAINPAPLASALVQNASLQTPDTYSGAAALTLSAPVGAANNPMALQVSAGAHSNYLGVAKPAAIWGDSSTGYGLWASTDTGSAILASASSPSGKAADFIGNVSITGNETVNGNETVTGNAAVTGFTTLNNGATINNSTTINGNLNVSGNLNMPRFKSTIVINQVGPLPITSGSFTTSGGTLLVYYSGSGYADFFGSLNGMIGMTVAIDGGFIDNTAIYANNAGMHLAFVAKQWVLTGIPAGTHTISLTAMNAKTLSDSQDIYYVSVVEMPY